MGTSLFFKVFAKMGTISQIYKKKSHGIEPNAETDVSDSGAAESRGLLPQSFLVLVQELRALSSFPPAPL